MPFPKIAWTVTTVTGRDGFNRPTEETILIPPTLDIVEVPERPPQLLVLSRYDTTYHPGHNPPLYLVLVNGRRYDAFLHRDNAVRCIHRIRDELSRNKPSGRSRGPANTC